jgi:hypothetical protein
VRIQKQIRKPVRVEEPGLSIAADINGDFAGTAGEPGRTTRVRSQSHVRTVQSSRRRPGGAGQSTGGSTVTEETSQAPTEGAELTTDELEQQQVEELPDREAMSLINANVAAPVNAAVALNALSDNSVAVADATQQDTIQQTN